MSTPIKPEDIKKGDHIRKEYPLVGRNFSQTAVEYIAIFDGETSGSNAATFYLLDRPKPAVVLPTSPGTVLDSRGDFFALDIDGKWTNLWNGNTYDDDDVPELLASRGDGSFKIISRPVAEVAAEVLADVRVRSIRRDTDSYTVRDLVLDNIADDFGVFGVTS